MSAGSAAIVNKRAPTAAGMPHQDNNYQLDGEYAINELLAPKEQIQLVNYVNADQSAAAIKQLTAAVTTAQSTARGRARIALAAALLNTPDVAVQA